MDWLSASLKRVERFWKLVNEQTKEKTLPPKPLKPRLWEAPSEESPHFLAGLTIA